MMDNSTEKKQKILIGIPDMIAVILIVIIIGFGVIYLSFGTLSIADMKYTSGIDVGSYNAVDYEKYRMVYFISPGEQGKVFAAKLNDMAIIYEIGFIDKRLADHEERIDSRFRKIEKGIAELKAEIGALNKKEKIIKNE